MGFHIFKAIKESLLTTQDDIIVRGASAAERLNIAAQRLVGRITGGHVTGLTATQIRTLLGIEAGSTADLTGLEIVALLEALAANDRLDHGAGLTGLTGNDHTQYILHSLAAAANDFLVASGANAYVKKTLAETLTILAHTIASHSDTTATGAELETLTDGSETELHSHPADGDGATKEFYVPATDLSTDGVGVGAGTYPAVRLNAGNDLKLSFKAPHDFTALTHCKVIYLPNATGTFDWTVQTNFAAVGEAFQTHIDGDTADAVDASITLIQEVDVSAAFTNLSADDYVGFQFKIDALATITIFNFFGLVFKYS